MQAGLSGVWCCHTHPGSTQNMLQGLEGWGGLQYSSTARVGKQIWVIPTAQSRGSRLLQQMYLRSMSWTHKVTVPRGRPAISASGIPR